MDKDGFEYWVEELMADMEHEIKQVLDSAETDAEKRFMAKGLRRMGDSFYKLASMLQPPDKAN